MAAPMVEAWYTGYPDELARLLVDAASCAEACEAFLIRAPEHLDLLAAPAAVSRVLIDLIDQPPQLVLAAARLTRETALHAADLLDDRAVVDALRAVGASADALLDAAG
jgi:hypothetical protein